MKRVAIIAIVDEDDSDDVEVLDGGAEQVILELGDEDEYKCGLDTVLESCAARALHPSARAIDLLVVATAVFAADMGVSRKSFAQDGWTRELHLYIPVVDADVWTDATPLLRHMLQFLTGDIWRFTFRERDEDLPRDAGASDWTDSTAVSLFSGGLDSFSGAVEELAGDDTPILVGHYMEGQTSTAQDRCHRLLSQQFGHEAVRRFSFYVGFRDALEITGGGENTQRSRSFLFFALGTLVASSLPANAQRLLVPENGFIALNVPLDSSRLGALSTRTTHPYYMQRFRELLEELELYVDVSNPFELDTKGEMLANSSDAAFLERCLASTSSCSSPAKSRWKGLPPGVQCGHCVPCLIRRAAILHAYGSDPTEYVVDDLSARVLNSTAAEGAHVRSFQFQAEKLKGREQLAGLLVRKSGPLEPDDVDEYAQVYLRGVKEMARFLAGVTAKPT